MDKDAQADTAVPRDIANLVAALFEQYHMKVFAYLYRLLHNRDLAHDLTQETFLRLLHSGRRLTEIENHRAWIYRLASNLAFNALKRQRRFTWLPWHTATTLQLAHPDPADMVAEQMAIVQALAALPPHYRAPLLLYTQCELNIREIAAILQLSESNTKVRLHRAREKFRQVYGEGDIAK